MIQEIYDYLLIRSGFIFNNDSIYEFVKDKESFKYIIHCAAELMQKENFFIVYPDALKNLSSLIQKYRFDYNKDKEINSDMNFIIERKNEYDHMSLNRKIYLSKKWLSSEFKDRELPVVLQTDENVTASCLNEISTFICIAGYKLDDTGESYEYVGDKEDIVLDVDTVNYLSLINLIANRYPGFYYDEFNLKNALYNVKAILDTKPNFILLRYIRKTMRNLKKLEKEINQVSKELVKELKKTK